MNRSLILIGLVLLAACSPVDPCTADPNLPNCRAQNAVANATIAAVDMERAASNREATRQAKAAEQLAVAQSTQAAASANATQIAVSAFGTKSSNEANAQATKSALEIQAMTQTLMVSATIAAISVDTARVKSSIELSTTQLVGKAEVDQRQMEADTATSRTALWMGLVAFVIGVIGVSFAWGFRRVTNAVANLAEVRSALVVHGAHAWLVTPGKDGQKNVTALTNLLGDHTDTAGIDSIMGQLDVPDREKLQALVALNRMRALVDVSANVHAFPEVEERDDETAVQTWSGPRYQIMSPTERPQLLAGIPQAEDVLDAEWRKVEMSA